MRLSAVESRLNISDGLKTPDPSPLSLSHLSFSRQTDKLDTSSLYLLLDLKSRLEGNLWIFGCLLVLSQWSSLWSISSYDMDQTQIIFLSSTTSSCLPSGRWTLQIWLPIANQVLVNLGFCWGREGSLLERFNCKENSQRKFGYFTSREERAMRSSVSL